LFLFVNLLLLAFGLFHTSIASAQVGETPTPTPTATAGPQQDSEAGTATHTDEAEPTATLEPTTEPTQIDPTSKQTDQPTATLVPTATPTTTETATPEPDTAEAPAPTPTPTSTTPTETSTPEPEPTATPEEETDSLQAESLSRRNPEPEEVPDFQAYPLLWDGWDGKAFPYQFDDESMTVQSTTSALALGQPGFVLRYVETFGVTEEAYPVSTAHLNRPIGLFMDGSDNLYVAEEHGCRALRYDTSGSNTLSIGVAGLCFTDDGGDVFSGPQDIAIDGSGNIWVADQWNRVVQYDSSGNFLQTLPASNSWESGSDNTHFNFVIGIAFDSSGRMFVSDRDNNRVQVYTFSGNDPVYSATIGETGGAEGQFNNPTRIAVDSSDRLYVADADNGRVQRCTDSGGWTCSNFDTDLFWPEGIAIDGSDNVFIADGGNSRIRKCTSAGSCGDFVTGLDSWVSDLAVDSSGNVYASFPDTHEVRKYNSAGESQGLFVGKFETPYQLDTSRIYSPHGLAVASDGSIYVSEQYGYRLLKLNSGGVQQWTVGQAGVYGSDNNHFGDYWDGPEGGLAIDSSGRIYVSDRGNHRIQIYDSAGGYYDTFGGYGNGDYEFDRPAGVAIHPTSGDIYVVDKNNHRVQVYDSSWAYKATLGVTGASGNDASHFDEPEGIAVDANGNVFVADTDNERIQKCTVIGSGGTCTTFAGVTDVLGDDFDHFNNPVGLAADDQGRVYVVDQFNNRVQVFDSSGAYLTSINGAWGWGANTGQLRSPVDVTVDDSGDVYVSDNTNHRIHKYTIGVPDWEQTNINGFGDWQNLAVLSLTPFDGQLYAGTYHQAGAQLWRASNGQTWNSVITAGFGDTDNVGVDHLYEFNGDLYAGTWNDNGSGSSGGQIWRSADGSAWSQVVSGGFDKSTNGEVFRFVEFNSQLYASTWSYDTAIHGGEIWRSSTGDNGTWSRVVDDGFGDSDNTSAISFEIFNNYLYAGTGNESTGGEIWRSASGDAGSWAQVNTDGFGDSGNTDVTALADFNGYLYAITHHEQGGGAQIWRCQTCDGTDWTQVVADGFGDSGVRGIPGLQVYNNKLYAVVGHYVNGLEVWRSSDGTNWSQVGYAGFGDSNNDVPYWDNSLAIFENSLYIGNWNVANGGEVWMHEELPIPPSDFDGDGYSDPAKFYESNGTVWWMQSSTGTWQGEWLGSDTFEYVSGDFDGDGKSDPAKFYQETGTVWWIPSSSGVIEGEWLGPDTFDYISNSDFDGDGKSDPAKFYQETGTVWWIPSSTGVIEGEWLGADTFSYVEGCDYDGDGKTDPTKYYEETGTVWWIPSSTGVIEGVWLGADDFTFVGGSDFDGDGKSDPAKFYENSGNLWWIASSTGEMDGVWLGGGTFTFVGGNDFDGDGITDPAKFDASTGTLSWLASSTGTWDSAEMGTDTDTYELIN
jgi:uncharacterized protein YjiK/outer membrane biosynthesis protein TonB